jgi:hypothetical protein
MPFTLCFRLLGISLGQKMRLEQSTNWKIT